MSGGVRSALEQVLDGKAGGEALAEVGLFDDLDASETGALDQPSPLTAALAAPTRQGRRPGSRNRRTEATLSWLLQQHRHPLSVMMEAYSMSPGELALRIGIASPDDAMRLEILKLQLRMAEAVAPYIAQKLPQAVQIDARAGLTLTFEGVSLPARSGSVEPGGDVIEGQLAVRLPEVGHNVSDDELSD